MIINSNAVIKRTLISRIKWYAVCNALYIMLYAMLYRMFSQIHTEVYVQEHILVHTKAHTHTLFLILLLFVYTKARQRDVA